MVIRGCSMMVGGRQIDGRIFRPEGKLTSSWRGRGLPPTLGRSQKSCRRVEEVFSLFRPFPCCFLPVMNWPFPWPINWCVGQAAAAVLAATPFPFRVWRLLFLWLHCRGISPGPRKIQTVGQCNGRTLRWQQFLVKEEEWIVNN